MANKENVYLVTDIDYDTDGEKIKLPKELKIIVPDEEHTCYEDIEHYISNEISNITGFCHNGFSTTPEIPNV
jgi:hypothetical protein